MSRTLSRATTSTTNLLCCAHTTSIIYYYFISCLSFCSHHISHGIVYFDNQKKNIVVTQNTLLFWHQSCTTNRKLTRPRHALSLNWYVGWEGGGEVANSLQQSSNSNTLALIIRHNANVNTHTHTQLNINMYSSIRIHIGMRK